MGDLINRALDWLGLTTPAPAPPMIMKAIAGTPVATTGDGNLNSAGTSVNTLPGIIGVSPAANLALSSAAVWSCCRLISNSIATTPTQLFELTKTGKIPASKHPLFRVLTKSPNPNMTMQQWIQPTLLSLLLWGNGYTWVDTVGDEVIGLWPLNPARVQVLLQADGTFAYYYSDWRGKLNIFTDENCIHFRMFSMDGYLGLPVLIYHQQTIQLQQASQAYAVNMYVQGGQPAGVLQYPGSLKKEQVDRIRDSWTATHSGSANAGHVAILEEGMEYKAIGIPPEQLQYIEEQKFSVEQIARIFGVPPHLIGAANQPTYASVEQQSIEFVRYTITPYAAAIEQAINKHLLDDDHIFRFDLNSFERGDLQARYSSYATGRQWGWLSANDIRTFEDMQTIEHGDEYLTPLNMVPAGTEPVKPTTPAPAPAAPMPAPMKPKPKG